MEVFPVALPPAPLLPSEAVPPCRVTLSRVFYVRVPATLANLGSGFDALGVALDLYLEMEAHTAAVDRFSYSGEGQVDPTPDNLIHQGYRAAWEAIGEPAPPVEIEARNPIPLARGMGSSSAALVAGAALADALSGGKLGRDGVFALTARLEGHPDNVAPAIYGGFVAALADPPLALPLPSGPDLVFVLGVPAYEVPTPLARKALPKQVAHKDAVFNLARAALWPAALYAGRMDVLREAARDLLHQPYRAHLMPGLEPTIEKALQAGAYAAFVGGAGPTIAAVTPERCISAVRLAFSEYVGSKGTVLTQSVGKGYSWKEISKPSP